MTGSFTAPGGNIKLTPFTLRDAPLLVTILEAVTSLLSSAKKQNKMQGILSQESPMGIQNQLR